MIPRRTLNPAKTPGLQPGVLAPRNIRLLPHYRNPATWTSRAWESSSTGQKKSGHIETGQNERVLFFDNLFPRKLSPILLRRPFQSQSANDNDIAELLKRFNTATLGPTDPIRLLKRSLPEDLPVEVSQILLRLKDGGAFVKFRYPPEATLGDIETNLHKYQESRPVKPWFSPFRGVRANLVQGVPWLEDLLRFPKRRIKVEFVPADADGHAVELSQEHLYSLFRRYGKIAEIASQASDSKITPRFAYMDFTNTRDAIMARNCLHGLVVDAAHGGGKSGTMLRLSYEERPKTNWFWNWVKSHPRVVIPIIAAVVAAVTVAVFDPIRTFFVKMHIQGTFNLANSKLYRWFKSQTSDLLPPGLGKRKNDEQKSLGTIWEHRKEMIKKIRTWLLEQAESIIVIQGPRGSGKKELLLDQALAGREHVVVVDIKPIIDARGESATIRKLAQAVGYRPIFSWANSMSSILDMAVQSTTGVKSGFSETLESQIAKILHTTSAALKKVALSRRDDDGVDRNLSDDAWLEAHPEKRPVVVVDNFLHTPATGAANGGNLGDESARVLNDKMSEWAATMVHNNVAHVVVLVEDGAAASKALSKSMPDQGFKSVTLGDLSPEVAKNFILGHLDDNALERRNADGEITLGEKEKEDSGPFNWLTRRKMNEEKSPSKDQAAREKREVLSRELDQCIPVLGGRLNDLELLARRIRSGQNPQDAVEEIISGSSSDLLKSFLLTKKKEADRKWSPEQAWYLIQKLAAAGSARYNEVVADGRFTGTGVPGVPPEEAVESLVGEELVALRGSGDQEGNKITAGRPASIRLGRPVYQAAFRALSEDRALEAKMEMGILMKQVAAANKGIESAEKELALLSQVGKSRETAGRVEYLMRKIEGAHNGIEQKEKKMGAWKGVFEGSD
ncbi:mitochondrial escape protein 2 [Zalerion maritima]|uniref:Mitochondrial escape protein 2 n=1 Tax=Zalerion maritima TaxID=339359 RepID=A0AAD5S3L5_9PEZI|nr:mitochondrial escape protein 2 [Zalerion maritima]